ncbi:hypothetical protein JCM16307_02870 [Thermococcus prieurii]
MVINTIPGTANEEYDINTFLNSMCPTTLLIELIKKIIRIIGWISKDSKNALDFVYSLSSL